jgi:hypothetical protein
MKYRRPGAGSGVVARKLKIAGPVSIDLVGAGHQSRMKDRNDLPSAPDLASLKKPAGSAISQSKT